MTKCPYCGAPENLRTKCCTQVDNLWKTNAELAGMLQNAVEKLKEALENIKKEKPFLDSSAIWIQCKCRN